MKVPNFFLFRCILFYLYLFILFQTQKEDKCAKEIRLSYPGYNSSYSSVSDIPIVYELLLKQGVMYDLTIYLNLSDGAEMIFWRQQYTTSLGALLYFSCCIIFGSIHR